jgi:protein-S-isoprenylcysteine O-methyltransferase Ste14
MSADDPVAETAGVAAPPPLIFGATLALGLALGRNADLDARSATYANRAGAIALAAGALIGAAALAGIKRVGSSASPYRPTTALATGGIFRFSRNPGYVGATSIYLGIALRRRSIPALALLPVALALTDRLVVTPEERYLERRFGAEYTAYRNAVPRWF